MKQDYIRTGLKIWCHFVPFETFIIIQLYSVLFTHSPRRWNHGSTDGLFLLLFLSSHHQLFVSLRYRKRQFSNWFDFPGNSSDSYLPPPPPPSPSPQHQLLDVDMGLCAGHALVHKTISKCQDRTDIAAI